MDEMQEKLGAILNDPNMMQKIMGIAQGLGQKPPPGKQDAPKNDPLPELDLNMLQNISRLAQNSRIDKREQALLGALGAYLSQDRIGRLEKAMKAAKLARLATSAMGSGQFPLSR